MVKFTIKRGKVVSESNRQHRFLHASALDHTHIEGGRHKRETFTASERKEALKTLRGVSSMERTK